METSELIKKVRKIEIKSRGLSNQIFSGEYHSAFKGRGMAFSEVREYMPGDDIRAIDWNVTARFNHPYIKVFEEEREMTVMLLVDCSASENYGTQKQLKKDLITEMCAVLSFSAIQNNDKIGVIFFSDIIEKYIPPKKGKAHILLIIRELLEFKPKQTKTNITQALRFFTNVVKKRCTAFVISDFMDENSFMDALKIAGKKHDTIALRIYDKHENVLPDMGLVKFRDVESGEIKWFDTSNATVRNHFYAQARLRQDKLNQTFTKSGIDVAHINTADAYIKPLTNLFKKRAKL